jgi:hypothetical protein
MRINGFVVHGAVTAAVFASGVGAAITGAGGGSVTLAGPQVLRLIQNAPAALASYPAVDMSMKFTVHAGGHTGSVNESGHLSSDGKTGSFDVSGPSVGVAISAIGVNNTIYMRASQQSAAMFGKPWLGLTITPGSGASPAQAPTGGDALSYLQLMPGATGEVRKVGHDTIAGVRTTHYRVTIDLLKAEQRMPLQTRHASAGQLEQFGLRTLPVDVWLDAQNRIRQQKFVIHVQDVTIDCVLRISGSNKPVQVTAPPASDVHFVSTATELYQDATQH